MVAKPKRGESKEQALAESVSAQSGGVDFEWTFGASRVDIDTHDASDAILAGLGATRDERLPTSRDLRRHLGEAVHEWIELKRDPGVLYRGAWLAQALDWIEDHLDELDPPEREFLKASRALQVSEHEATKQRAAQLHSRMIYLAGALMAASLVGIAASLFAIRWSETADRNATLAAENSEFAITVQAEANARANVDAQAAAEAIAEQRDEAQRQAQVARSGQLAAQAQAVIATYPQRSLLLAIEALKITSNADDRRTAPAADALRQALSSAADIQLSRPEHVGAVALSGDGHWLASRGSGGTARLWDVTNPAPVPVVLRGHKFAVHALAFSGNGHWLATGSLDNTARLWDISAGAPTTAPIVLRGHQAGIEAVAFSRDDRWLAAGSRDGNARVWDVSAGAPATEPLVLRGHTSWVVDLTFSDDGRWLATGSLDKSVKLWEITAGASTAEPVLLRGHEAAVWAVAFSRDGHWLATGSRDGTARLWDMTTGAPAANAVTLRGHESDVLALAFSEDGHWLATGSRDGAARVWDVSAGVPASEPIVLRGYESPVSVVTFSRDGRWLAVGSEDGTLRWWSLQLDELIDLACRAAGRNFTRAEWRQYFPGEDYRKTCEQWLEGK